MDFLKVIKRRTFISEVIYISLNILLAFMLVLLVRMTGSMYPSFALVFLSKWRVLAVRMRFWNANIQANLVSFIVSISFVVFLYTIGFVNTNDTNVLIFQIVLALIYIFWLLYLRPKSKRHFIIIQAGLALFTGTIAIYALSYDWTAAPVVALMWLVGYASARHVLSNYDESYTTFLSLVWGLITAEIGWLAYHWTIAYTLPAFANARLPQVSIIVLCLGFIAFKCYDSNYHNQKIRVNDILLPLVFSISIIVTLILAFNSINTGI